MNEFKVAAKEIALFVEKVQDVYQKYWERSNYKHHIPKVSFSMGRKYAKIFTVHFRNDGTPNQRIVYGFIDLSNGDMLKAESWKGPAKNYPRGNIRNPEDILRLRNGGII